MSASPISTARLGRISTAFAIFLAVLALPLRVGATLGPFEHGNGIPALGFGGISYGVGLDTTALAANPAHAGFLDDRYDIGMTVGNPKADGRIRDNAAAPDSQHDTGTSIIVIPQGGMRLALNDRWAIGFTLQSAGIGPEYEDSPYRRFGGGPSARLGLGQTGLITALAFRPVPDQSIGVALNISYQSFRVDGLEAFTAPEGNPNNVSVAPESVTNVGNDRAFGIGFLLGWQGRLAPGLQGGIAYRSPTYTQKHDAYRGLLPEGGRLQLPAIYGAGLAYELTPSVTLAFDFQRYLYSDEKAFSNRLSQLADGNRLGSNDGPGFGFRNQNAFKFGIAWQYNPALTLRAGYIRARQIGQRSETLFGFFGAVTATTHYTLGASYDLDAWTISGFASHAPAQTLRGEGSIPPAFGGGEADFSFEVSQIGLSVGRRF